MPTYGTTAPSTSPIQLELDLIYEPDQSRHDRLASLLFSAMSTGLNSGSTFRSQTGSRQVIRHWHVNETVDQFGEKVFLVRFRDPGDRRRWQSKTFTDRKQAEAFAKRVQG